MKPDWMYARWKPDQLRAVSVARLDEYLRRHGWVERPSPHPRGRYYEHPDILTDAGQPVDYLIPDSDHYADYPLRMAEFLDVFSEDRGISAEQLFRELTEAEVPAAPPKPKRRRKPA